eukprot:15430413-Alexandrium_andersonii.AAC.1
MLRAGEHLAPERLYCGAVYLVAVWRLVLRVVKVVYVVATVQFFTKGVAVTRYSPCGDQHLAPEGLYCEIVYLLAIAQFVLRNMKV